MLWHPDRFSNEEDEEKKSNATKRFQIISKAYTVLSDPEKRKLYDSTGKVLTFLHKHSESSLFQYNLENSFIFFHTLKNF